MAKHKKTRDKKYRKVYPYVCTECGKRRIAFVFERAKAGKCTKCEQQIVDESQGKLFQEDNSL